VCAVVAAPTTAPASVAMDGRRPAPPANGVRYAEPKTKKAFASIGLTSGDDGRQAPGSTGEWGSMCGAENEHSFRVNLSNQGR
jgi:hypothetical protein